MMTYEQFKLIKLIARLATMVSVSKVTHDIIANNTVVETGFDQARVWFGGMIIGAMVAEQATDHVDRKIDGAVAWWANLQEQQNSQKTPYKSDR